MPPHLPGGHRERTVAIELLPPQLANNEQLRARFEREAKTVSSLNH
jgi:serine/threonine protein kinase